MIWRWMVRLAAATVPAIAFVTAAGAQPLSVAKWGDPMWGTGATISWAIVADGVPQGDTSWGNVPGGNIGFDRFLPDGYDRAVRSALEAWAAVADLRFVEVADGGEAFGTSGPAMLRFWGGYTDNNYLAWTYYPNSDPRGGDLFLNSRMDFAYGDDPIGYRLDWVLRHEIGHALGLAHDADPTSVMFAYYPLGRGEPNDGDLRAIRELYGSAPLAIPEAGTAGLLGAGVLMLAWKKCRTRPMRTERVRPGLGRARPA